MDQEVALRMIAEKAYDVGYSAKLHFSTHDIVEKAPGWIGMIPLIIGVLSLYIDDLAAKHVSAYRVSRTTESRLSHPSA